MLVFVDYETPEGRAGEYGQPLRAARTWITYRLEDLSGQPCMLVRYDRISQQLLGRIGATAIFISGNSTDPQDYEPESVVQFNEIIRRTPLPIFGFCGGFQAVTLALGAPLIPIQVGSEQQDLPELTTTPDGKPFEYGYHPVDVLDDHPVLAGLGPKPVFRHAHGLHVPELPNGFRTLAETAVTPVQLAVHDERRIVGTQFHPEYWTDEHPDGRTMIANFLRWAGVAEVAG